MKKHLSPYRSSLLLLTLVISLLCSCKKNNRNEYIGDNKIFLSAANTNFISSNGHDEIVIDVRLVKSLNHNLDLEFELVNNQYEGENLLALEQSKGTIKAGEKHLQLKIISTSKKHVASPQEITLQLRKKVDAIALDAPLKISVLASGNMEQLSKAQVELLDGYKAQGLNLYPLMGEIDVEGKIEFPGGGNLISLYDKKTATFKSKTQITLSEHATANKPVIKMTSNAMGIEKYLYTLFRNVTIDDKEFWNPDNDMGPPGPKHIMKLISLSPSSVETFGLALDHIEIDLKTKNVNFVNTKILDKKSIQCVNFTFSYSAWDRLKALIDQGNPNAIENSLQGGTVDPDAYINTENVSKDEYKHKDRPWRPATSSFDAHTLSFQFPLGHEHMDDYIQFSIQYTF